jgi:two-component system, LuxR family, sensor kinase FixL
LLSQVELHRRRNVTTTPYSASDDPVRDERFLLGIEGAGIGIWDLDLSTHRLLWSNITRTFFGVPNELPLTYELFLSLLDPHDRERTEQAVKRSVETGCSFDMQYHIDGQSHVLHKWVRARGSVVRDQQGVAHHLSGLMIDIDDQKQVEEALRTKESHLRSILETIPDAMIVIDGNGIIQFFAPPRNDNLAISNRRQLARTSAS